MSLLLPTAGNGGTLDWRYVILQDVPVEAEYKAN